MSEESNRPVLSPDKRERLQALLAKEGLAKESAGLTRQPRTGALPLSSGQERLWFLEQFEPGLAAYNIPAAAWIQGPLNVQQLRASFEGVVARHEILRTTFRSAGGRPQQVIQAEPSLPFEHVDLTTDELDDAARDARALELANAESRRPFDLQQGPLTRVFLWKTGPERHLLLVLMHHIVSEGATLSWMFEEVQELYAAALEGRPHTLPEQTVEYADFALWQRDWIASGGIDADLEYWKQKLSGELQPLQLPTDRPRQRGASHAGAWLTRTLPNELVREVQAMAKQERASLYMACHAALDVLFYRTTQQDDLLIGGVVGMRPRKETERMFGFFINTVVHRIDASGNPTYRELLRRVRDEALDVFAHHEAPFERVVEAAQPDRDQRSAPLLQVIYDHESVESIGGLHLLGTEPAQILRPEYVHNGCSKADLVFFTEESTSGLITSVEYNTDLFDEPTIERLIDHFEIILRGAVGDPEQRIGTMKMMGAAEREAVVSGFNGEASSYPVYCIQDELARLAAERPDAPALRCEGQTYTRWQLEERANRIAQRLVARGVGPDVLVGICVTRGFDMVAGALGILKAGGGYLPIDPKLPAERAAFMLEDSRAPVLLTEQSLRESLARDLERASGETELIFLDDPTSGLDDEPAEPPAHAATPADIAYAIYTSGSTGKPKGVPIPHANFARLMNATADWYGFSEEDVWITLHSFGFDFSVWEVWGALVTGGSCVLPSSDVAQSPDLRLEVCAREGVTVLNQTPSAFVQLIEAEQARDESSSPELALRLVIFGGEALELQSLRPWFERHGDQRPRLVNMYGITETTVHVTYRPLSMRDLDEGRGSVIGVPIPDLKVYVLDEWRNPVPIGVTGELYVGGAGVAPGYLNRPELSAERFVTNHLEGQGDERLYRTGDLGRWLPDGELEYLGRIDNQVQLRGYRIELGEIDACIGEHPGVSQVLTLAREDRLGDKRLAAYVVPQDGASPSASDLKAHTAARLPEYMVPSAVIVLDAFPLTINGKIDRRALPAPDVSGEDLGVAFVAPRTPTEEILCARWREVLGLERVGATDNFFELGGHSLLATVLLSRIREAFEVDLPLRGIFEAPTVERMAALIDGRVAEDASSTEDAAKGAAGLRSAAATLPPILVSDRSEGPLSFDQESIWFFQGLGPESPAYNVPVQIALAGELSEEHLAQAFIELARRHEALRTSFEDRGGEPVQIVHAEVAAAADFLRIVDLTDHGPSAAADEKERLALDEAATLFDLTRAPLFRALVVRTAPSEATLVFNVHHLVVDGWSHGRLLEELISLYGALANGSELPAARPAARMVDYAVWQREAFPKSEAWREELAWWTAELNGAPPLIELPTDRPRPAQQRFEGGSERLKLSSRLADDLRALARQEGATLFHVTLAAYQALLHRVTHQDDLLIGAPIAKRTQKELEFAIGNVINTVALRSRTTEASTLRDLIAQARETMLGVDAHQDLPWEAIVQELAPERNPSTTPIVQVGFTLRDKGREQVAGGVRFGIPSELSNGTTKSDLTVVVEEIEGELQVLADYPTSLYEPATVQRFLGWYATLLEAMVSDPSTKLNRARYLPQDQFDELVVRRNDTAVPYARDAAIHHLFEEQARRTPKAVALIEGGEKLTFAELNAQANRWAHLLQSLGVGPEELVGLCADRSMRSVVGLLGILKAGGAYLPLDPEYPRARLELMLGDAAPRIVLTQSNLRDVLPRGGGSAWSGETLDLDAPPPELAAQPHTDPAHSTDGDSLFNVLYTSGSTGRPKGVMLIHRAFVNRLDWQQRNIPWQPGEVASQKTTFNFVDSIPELFAPLCHGVPQVIVPDQVLKDPAALVPLLAKHRVTRVGSVPALVRTLLESYPDLSKRLPRAKYWMLGGDAIPLDLARAFAKALPKAELWNLYGASEVEGDVLIHCANERLAPTGVPSGRAVQNTRVYLLDDVLEPVGEGVVGQIHAGGDCLSRGYINQPELTAASFVRDPFSLDPEALIYRLGDLGRWMPTGEIEYLGRADQQVSLRGFRVELGEVEGTILENPDVGMAVALTAKDSSGNTRLVCYVSPSEAVKAAKRTLREIDLTKFMAEQLPYYMVPSLFVVLDEFPLTPNGKIDRQALPDVKDVRSTSEEAPDKPSAANEVERMLTEVWSEVLGVDDVGVEDDFFELGGHSLLAVKLVNKVNDAFGAHLALGSLVNAPTIRAQGKALEDEVGSEKSDCLVKIQEGGDRVPFFCVCSIGGTVLNQRPLARRLGEEQPFYGLQAVDLDSILGREATLEEFAAHYIERIRKVWPNGPYRIGGHSFGAMVAFEMARQLEAAGDEVDLVAIFDSGPPNIHQDLGDRIAGVGVFARGLPYIPLDFYERWKQDPERLKRELKHRGRFIGKLLKILATSPRAKHGRYSDGTAIPSAEAAEEFARSNDSVEAEASAGPSTGGVTVDDFLDFTEWPERYRDIARRHSRAVRNYIPGQYGGKITLYRSRRQPLLFGRGMRLGWERVARGGVEVHTVSGNHLSILAEPHVDVLAAKLRRALGVD